MDRMVTMAWRSERGSVVGTRIGVHIVILIGVHIVLLIGVSEDDYGRNKGTTRRGGGDGDEGECEVTGSEQWGHLLHVGHTAHVPLSDVLVESIRLIEHVPACRHAADGRREGGRTHRQVKVYGSGVDDVVAVTWRGHRGGVAECRVSSLVHVVMVIVLFYK